MKTIHKYAVGLDITTITIPIGAKFLSVQIQHDKPQMWFLVDTNKRKEPRNFCIFGTGHEYNITNGQYRGTFLANGDVVSHLFELV